MSSTEPKKYRNYYRCTCGEEWHDEWSCMCNDRCPACNLEIEPHDSEELCLECGAIVDEAKDGKCPQCGEPIKDFDELQNDLADGDGAGGKPVAKTITARFFPQAWQNDYAIDVDPEGETLFDVTAEILALGEEKALALKDNREQTDSLQNAMNAPEWIKEWKGPFYIEVSEAVHEYYGVEVAV